MGGVGPVFGSGFSSNNLPSIILPYGRSLVPAEGPKCIPVPMDFLTQPTFILDYGNMARTGQIQMVQSAWIDNSNNPVDLTITIPGTSQVLKIPAETEGYYTLICPNPIKIQFDSTQQAVSTPVLVILLNYPVMPQIWPEPAGSIAAQFSQVSTDALVDVAGSLVDLQTVGGGVSVATYSWKNTGANSINVEVIGFNRPDASDAVNISGSGIITTAAGSTGSDVVNVNSGITRFLKLILKSTGAGAPGTISGGFYSA